ncbi:MAG: hypothetical protein KJ941_13360, partial [Bacteroidetes bacterium]|nr:hypothetical protein [Bacteroidota bacterium]
RNPYKLLESQYHYRSWAVNFPFTETKIKSLFPHFPNLSIEDFIEMKILCNEDFLIQNNLPKEVFFGEQTLGFIRLFFKNHLSIHKKLNVEYFTEGHYKADMCNVSFIKNENLNEELIQFLQNYEFTQQELKHIRNHKKVNVSSEDTFDLAKRQMILDYINEHEWALLLILADLGIHYKMEKKDLI